MVYENVCTIISLPIKRISVISHSEKHLSEFYPQDGGESQLTLKLRHSHPMYTHTWRDRSRIAGGRSGEEGSAAAPRRRCGPSSHPHSRLQATGRGRERRSAIAGQPQDARPENRQPFPPVGFQGTIGRRRGRMGVKQSRRPCLPRREARGGFSRPFPPFRNYFRFCKYTSGLTPTSMRTLFPY